MIPIYRATRAVRLASPSILLAIATLLVLLVSEQASEPLDSILVFLAGALSFFFLWAMKVVLRRWARNKELDP
jgi:hypothetical protein